MVHLLNVFKEFYNQCDWSLCGNGDGYIYSYESSGCKENEWHVNVVKENKKDGYYSYLMKNPSDRNRLQIGDIIDDVYLKQNCQLQAIYTINGIDKNGEIITNNSDGENCKTSNYTKFYNQYNDWEVGMKRVYDKWINTNEQYYLQLGSWYALYVEQFMIGI